MVGSRGNLTDIFFLLVILISIFIMVPLAVYALNAISTGVIGTYPVIGNAITSASQALAGVFNSAYVIILITVAILIMVSAVAVMHSYIAFLVGIFILIIALIFSMAMTQVADDLATNPTMAATYTAAFSNFTAIWGAMPIIVISIMILIIIVFVGKRSGLGGEI